MRLPSAAQWFSQGSGGVRVGVDRSDFRFVSLAIWPF